MSMQVINLSEYTSPEIKEEKKKGFVSIGDDNDYFQYLIDIYNSSPTNNAAINGIVELIYGGGLNAADRQRKPEAFAQFQSMFAEEDVRRVVRDLKQLGNAYFQVVYEVGKDIVQRVEHFPAETLRPEIADENGDVKAYYYSANWKKVKSSEECDRIPAFGFGSKTELVELFHIKPYQCGMFYFGQVDYQGATPYAEVEAELSQYHINDIKNGFSATTFISMNNGIPEDEKQNQLKEDIRRKLTGSQGAGKFIIEFNDNKEQASEIKEVPLQDAHSRFEFISKEAMQKIMIGHRVTSPMLMGIKDNTGLGNNADELKTAIMIFESTVINGFRRMILNAVERILAENNLSLKLYFESFNPFKEEAKVEETQLSEIAPKLSDEYAIELANYITEKGEPIDDIEGWDLIDEDWSIEGEENFDVEGWLNENAAPKEDKTLLNRVKTFLSAGEDSSIDSEFFKVRYVYRETAKKNPMTSGAESRPLCKELMSKNLMYRKEDIKEMPSSGGAEDKGKQYDVFLYKGGVNCQHGWERWIFKKRTKKDGSAWGGGALNGVTRSKLYEAIKGGAKINKSLDKKAYEAPRDTNGRGAK